MESKRTKYQKFEAVEMHRRDISGAPYNPRGLAPANRSRLKKGVKKHGIIDTVVFNKRTGQLVGGHQRLSVLDELEGTDDYMLTVQVIDVDENEEKLLNLALNNPSLQGYFEHDLQRELFEHLMSEGVDIEGAGYTTTDVQLMYPDIFASGQLSDQLAAEENIVNELHEMNRVGKEYEAEFRDDMGLAPTKAMLSEEAALANVEATEPTVLPTGSDGEPWKHDKEFFKGERQRTQDHNSSVLAETDVMVTFTFQTKAEMIGFMTAFGLDQAKRYFDVHEVQAAFGVEL